MAAGAGRALAQQRTELASRTELRVCADPANLPFSNEAGEGFENRIAALLGEDMGLPVASVWFPQVVGFVRNTLRARECDLIMGAVAGDGIIDTTNPYYRSGYMVVTRSDRPAAPRSLADPWYRDRRVGIVAATPPSDLMLRHGLLLRAKPYQLAVDTRHGNPARDMLQDVLDGEVDAGLVWGPIVGYAIAHDHLPLRAEFLEAEPDGPRMDFRIAMGVRSGEPEWRRRVNQAIERVRPRIDAVLAEYGVPRLDPPAPR